MAKLEKVFTLNTTGIINGLGLHFVVIGAGGTGGYLIPNLARQVSIMNRDINKHRLTVADADDVEDSNLVRQNFIQSDIGKNKANVMGRRYSGAFGMEIGTVPTYIEKASQLETLVDMYPATVPVIIGAVDNNKSRQLVYQFFKTTKRPLFWIDSGNSEYHAQVVMGFNDNRTRFNTIETLRSSKTGIFYMPSVVDLYPAVADDKETKFISEMSCAERAIHHPQCIATNITAANILFNMSNLLLNSGKMSGVTVGQVVLNTRTNGFTHFLNTEEYISTRYIEPDTPIVNTQTEVVNEVPYAHHIDDDIDLMPF